MDETNNNKNNEKILSMMVLEDDLYMYLEHRWIITLNVYNQHFEENVKKASRLLYSKQNETCLIQLLFRWITISSIIIKKIT